MPWAVLLGLPCADTSRAVCCCCSLQHTPLSGVVVPSSAEQDEAHETSAGEDAQVRAHRCSRLLLLLQFLQLLLLNHKLCQMSMSWSACAAGLGSSLYCLRQAHALAYDKGDVADAVFAVCASDAGGCCHTRMMLSRLPCAVFWVDARLSQSATARSSRNNGWSAHMHVLCLVCRSAASTAATWTTSPPPTLGQRKACPGQRCASAGMLV